MKLWSQKSVENKHSLRNAVGKFYNEKIIHSYEIDEQEIKNQYEIYFDEKKFATDLENLLKDFRKTKATGSLDICLRLFLLCKLHKPYKDHIIDLEAEIFGKGRSFSDEFGWEPSSFIQVEDSSNQKAAPILRLNSNIYANRSHHFAKRELKVIGRENEKRELSEFLEDDEKKFQWLQLAGAGGQGKSRLAYDLVSELNETDGFIKWDAGFLDRNELSRFEMHWDKWQPGKPTLIVIDYVVGETEKVGALMHALAYRASILGDRERQLHQPIRLLLIERQRWDRGGLALNASDSKKKNFIRSTPFAADYGTAEWFSKIESYQTGSHMPIRENRFRFQDGVIELTDLGEVFLLDIVRKLAQEKGCPISESNDFILKTLRRIDPTGRPLFAYFLSAALSAQADVAGWSREDLLRETIDREMHQRWRNSKQLEQSPSKSAQGTILAILATILRQIDCRSSIYKLFNNEDIIAAQILTDSPREEDLAKRFILGMEPDILGEYFVVDRMMRIQNASGVINSAWQIDANAASQFLLRLVQDFPYESVTAEFLNYDLSQIESINIADKHAVSVTLQLSLLREKEKISDVRKIKFPLSAIQILQRASKNGNIAATNNLGHCYQHGEGVSKDSKKAFQLYTTAANSGNSKAMVSLGWCYINGEGTEINYEMGAYWYEKAAKLGENTALYNLSRCYIYGQGKDINFRKAFLIAHIPVKKDFPPAFTLIGDFYYNGWHVNQDYIKAVFWYNKAIMLQDSLSFGRLGFCYLHGKGVNVNIEKAFELYLQFANSGNSDAMNYMGLFYSGEWNNCVDCDQLIFWYNKAIEKNNSDSLNNLGMLYYQGDILERDYQKSYNLLKRSAEDGNPKGMRNLASIYAEGLAVERNLASAEHWFKKALDRNETECLSSLAALYIIGEDGVSRNYQKAHELLQRGVKLSDMQSHLLLSKCYDEGIGVEKDARKAADLIEKYNVLNVNKT